MSTATNGHASISPATAEPPPPAGLRFERQFAHLPEVEWARRDVEIKDDKGKVIFRQEGVQAPKSWSERAVKVVAQKYFSGHTGGAREGSVDMLISRVVGQIAEWGRADGYFADDASAEAFTDDLYALCLHQHGSFNSPVWFNVGLSRSYGAKGSATHFRWEPGYETEHTTFAGEVVPCEDSYRWPQASACFIQAVADDMADIMRVAASEAMLFKYGSGTGTDLSTLRSHREKLSGGGQPSGPLSFMRIYDAGAAVIKSGGTTRRAAKMQTLKVRHPDVLEFAVAKVVEDRKARALIAAGYTPEQAYDAVLYQNCNMSVRASDAFLRAVEAGEAWTTRAVTTDQPMDTFPAGDLMDAIAGATWECGDPGLQYEDTIQKWHTCPNSAPINSSNPCGEYNFVDDSACNLASINLMKFRRADDTFDAARFRAAVRVFLVAQEILVDHACYPTDRIALNSHRFRPLGLGYANLGSLLMASGLPYDSDGGRSLAGAITAIMHGQALLISAEMARAKGPFEGFAANRDPMLAVVDLHRRAATAVVWPEGETGDLWAEGYTLLETALIQGRKHGFRNAQVTVLAPTGTIAFMMDCDTTGIEPEVRLVKDKALAGGGTLRIVNGTTGEALRTLGYGVVEFDDGDGYTKRADEVAALLDHVERTGSIEGPYSPGCTELKPEHLPVFDCAYPARPGGRSIAWMGHLKMMAAVQPFLSGAISKTVGMPEDATVADIRAAFLEAWRLGLKAVAIYRDNSKGAQPLTAPKTAEAPAAPEASPAPAAPTPRRERLPATRRSLTHKFDVAGHEGYLTVGFFPDGRPGELFVTMSKEGSTVGGLMDALATAVSIGLQYGVPLDVLVGKFAHSRFEPAGRTPNPDIPFAKSLTDYAFRWLGMELLPGYREEHAPRREGDAATPPPISGGAPTPAAAVATGPPCPECGGLTVRTGSCHTCTNCATSLGCS